MIVLRQGEPFGDPTALKLVHTNPMIKYLTGSPREELKAKLKHYTKFLFVRSPFIRLISAYRDKFEHYKKAFYDGYGRRMLRLYGNQSNPPTTSEEVLSSGVRPSFNHFVQYLLDPRTPRPLNEHWKQMHRLCHPCLVEYDFIGHQETLQDDAKHLLKILKIDNKIEFPPAYKNVTTKDYLLNYFKSVSIEDRQKLYQMYEMDFKLFGYPKPDGLLGS
ncbi:carbohydrate sulfotransferase 12-like [Antennarius striatus]|uniref:carbohydrate sulfotransferase 12-like n=1 Tax=Antennarius striatus TaxID=241820 RepID=UPI0035B455BB